MPTPAILLQDKNFPLRQSCSPGGHQVVPLSIHQQWRHEKSNWEGRKNTFIGNNHRKDLSCNLTGKKRVHLWNTSKCSLPFSPGKQDTTTQQCQFLLAKVLNKKVWVYCHMSYTIEHRIHWNLFANAAHWTEHISFIVTKLTLST